MITFLLYLNALLMIIIPVLLGRFIADRRNVGWGLFGIGAVTFIGSQVGHIPFNWIVLQRFQLIPTDTEILSNLIILSLFAGLSAGVFEEVARYLVFRYWATGARTWGKGLMIGAGHGGVEAILTGLLVALNVYFLAAMQGGAFMDQIPTEQLPLVEAQIEATFNLPWYMALLGALERVFAICFHLSASLMVMQVFIRGQIRWLFAAIFWHALLDATAVFAVTTWGAVITEVLVGIMALLSLGIIFWLRTPEPVEPALEPLPAVGPAKPLQIDVTAESLERSKYS
jgi:uncharacterized membrane protein YhfC